MKTFQLRALPLRLFCLGVLIVFAGKVARAQTAEEHASHHPEEAAAAAQPAASPASSAMPATADAPGMAGMGPPGVGPPAGAGPPPTAGGMGNMGEMMKGMGLPKAKEMYPSLMALPELTPEKRREVEQQAAERMHAGSMLMGQSLDTLGQAAASGDYKAMQGAASHLREGIGQLESGVAARRALAEGRAPREVALAWFKHQMNLASPADGEVPRGLFGVSVFHLFTMALLVAFALAMLAMYYFKMRRAAALFGRLDPDKGSPPPGSSSRLAGGIPPPAGKGPADAPGEKSAPASPDKSPKPPESASEKPPAPAPSPKAS
ncbi:MAG: hypothetical protein ACR2HH_13945 [Chthoniobacterales bacterium]